MYRAYNVGKNYELQVMPDLLRQAYQQELYKSFEKKPKTPGYFWGWLRKYQITYAIILLILFSQYLSPSLK